MIWGFEIICQYLEVPPSPNAFFFLFTLTCPNGGGLTTGWLFFFSKLMQIGKYFYRIRNLSINSNHSTLKCSELRRRFHVGRRRKESWKLIVCEIRIIPRVNKDDLTSEEWAVVDFFLTSFGEENLNLKCIVGVDVEAARRHLGYYLCFEYSCASCFVRITNLCFPFVDKMALKSAMAEFHRCLLKRPHEGDGSDNPKLVSSKEPKFASALGSFVPKVSLPKKQERKMAAKAKEIIPLEFEVPPTSKAESEPNV